MSQGVADNLHIQSASRSSFEDLMQNSQRRVYALALRLCGNPTEAEDLVQEAYIRAYRFFDRYDADQSFTSWMYRILTNVYIDTMRRKKRVRFMSLDSAQPNQSSWEIADETASPERNYLEKTMDEPIQKGLVGMNPEFRMAVVLADVEGMAYEDIAEAMNTSVGTVRSRIHRGRKSLKAFLTKNYPEFLRREVSE